MRSEYLSKYPHIAPEVIHGEFKQSIYSDIFSLGQLPGLSANLKKTHTSIPQSSQLRRLRESTQSSIEFIVCIVLYYLTLYY